jgi:hypothetical protein
MKSISQKIEPSQKYSVHDLFNLPPHFVEIFFDNQNESVYLSDTGQSQFSSCDWRCRKEDGLLGASEFPPKAGPTVSEYKLNRERMNV